MSIVPVLSGREIVKVLEQLGYLVVRQRGSHMRLTAKDKKPVTVPNYSEISRGLLYKILRDAEINIVEFLKLLNKN